MIDAYCFPSSEAEDKGIADPTRSAIPVVWHVPLTFPLLGEPYGADVAQADESRRSSNRELAHV